MVIAMLLSISMWLAASDVQAGAAQETQKPQGDEQKQAKPPRRGDVVVAKGCIRGGVIESGDLTSPSGGTYLELLTYRLTGEKNTLEEIKKEHDGHADVITGELRTDLPKPVQGRKIGNSRITIGVGPSRGMMPEPPPPMPVLKVASFEHTGINCR